MDLDQHLDYLDECYKEDSMNEQRDYKIAVVLERELSDDVGSVVIANIMSGIQHALNAEPENDGWRGFADCELETANQTALRKINEYRKENPCYSLANRGSLGHLMDWLREQE